MKGNGKTAKGGRASKVGKLAPRTTPTPPTGPPPGGQEQTTPDKVIKKTASAKGALARLRAFTKVEQDKLGIRTLVGEYVENGTNHGRKTYQKLQKIKGHEHVQVFIYYWDGRDGDDFSGWWFGDQVGGTQVWSRADSHGDLPPLEGWSVPWDKVPAEKDLLLVETLSSGATSNKTSAVALTQAKIESPIKSVAMTQVKAEETTDSAGADSPGALGLEATAERLKILESECDGTIQSVKDLVDSTDANCMDSIEAARASEQAQELVQTRRGEILKALREINDQMGAAKTTSDSVARGTLSSYRKRVHDLMARMNQENERIETKVANAQRAAEAAKRAAEEEERVAQLSEKENAVLQEMLSSINDLVSQAEDTVETAAIIAAPFTAEDAEDEDLDESATHTLTELDKAAAAATQQISDANKFIGQKVLEVRKFHEGTKTKGLQELDDMRAKIMAASTKLTPLKQLRKDYEQKVVAKKNLAEIVRKLAEAELQVEKAQIITVPIGTSQMPHDELKAADGMLEPVDAEIKSIMQKAAEQARNPTVRKEAEQVVARARACQTQYGSVKAILEQQRSGLKADEMLSQAREKVDLLEDAELQTQTAEMPFLRGVEDLPKEEAMQAIRECEEAWAKADAALMKARTELRMKRNDSKTKYSEALHKRIGDGLLELERRTQAIDEKLNVFKRDTSLRKVKAMLSNLQDVFNKAEMSLDNLKEDCQIFESSKLEDVSAEDLKAAMENAGSSSAKHTQLVHEAKNAWMQEKAKDNGLTAELVEFKNRLDAIEQGTLKQTTLLAKGANLRNAKNVLNEEAAKVENFEAEVKDVQALHASFEDAAEGVGIERLDSAIKSARVTYTATMKSLLVRMQSLIGHDSPLIAPLGNLKDKAYQANEALNVVDKSGKDQRDRARSQSILTDIQNKSEVIDAAMGKITTAEFPFLKGIEVLPLEELSKLVQEGAAAAEEASKAIMSAMKFHAECKTELAGMSESIAKPTLETLEQEKEKWSNSSAKVGQFRKDTESRKLTAQTAAGTEKVTSAEEKTKNASELAAKITADDLDKLSPEEAYKVCQEFAEAARAAQGGVEDAQAHMDDLWKRTKQAKIGDSEDKQKEVRQKLLEVKSIMTRSKKAANFHEQKFVAGKMLADVRNMISRIEEQMRKVTEEASPLIEKHGDTFIAKSNLSMIVEALKELTSSKSETQDTLFKNMGGDDGALPKKDFVTYLDKLPDLCGREDVTFSKEQQDAIFETVDLDKDGKISRAEFDIMFNARFVCAHGIAMTSGVDIASSKTIVKLEVNELIDALGEPVGPDELGVVRIECKLVNSDKTGWVTMKGNQGTVYLKPYSPYETFYSALQNTLKRTLWGVLRTADYIMRKTQALASHRKGPLAEARAELFKLRGKVLELQSKYELLKRKIADSNTKFGKREEEEKSAQQTMIDRNKSSAIVSALEDRVKVLGDAVSHMCDFVNDMVMDRDLNHEKCSKPLSMIKEAEEELAGAVSKALDEVRTELTDTEKNHQTAMDQGSFREAKATIARTKLKVEAWERRRDDALSSIKKWRRKLADTLLENVASALRAEVQQRSITLDALFEELAGESGAEQIAEEALFKKISELSLSLPTEQAKLASQHLGANGIGRRPFVRAMQLYYKCVKSIGLTSAFEIKDGKTLRLVALDETVEVLQGPQADPELRVSRIYVRAMLEGDTGWVTVKGNQGTEYMKPIPKPFYSCLSSGVPLEPEFRMPSDGEICRNLSEWEVLEMLEGPKKMTYGKASRAKVKACKDKATGWVTVQDCDGVSTMESDVTFYEVTKSTVFTTERDITACKMLRKLQVGEPIAVIEGPLVDKEANVTRIHGRSGAEQEGTGWVTIKGNAGTVFAEEIKNRYSAILRPMILSDGFSSSSSKAIRTMEKGEVVEIVEAPREETFEDVQRLKVRAIRDSVAGWVTLKDNVFKPWSAKQRCLREQPLHKEKSQDATVHRRLETGETVEALESPVAEGEDVRMMVRAEKDGAEGWVTLKDGQGRYCLRPEFFY